MLIHNLSFKPPAYQHWIFILWKTCRFLFFCTHYMLHAPRSYRVLTTCRLTWQQILTATGSPAMCVG
ncbi:MAG TPA: hypothetical protein DF667_06465 [Roseburia sp.]|nr:hypothetical protein [Roseburia sp.]